MATEPAPIVAQAPIVTSGRTLAFVPTYTPSPIWTRALSTACGANTQHAPSRDPWPTIAPVKMTDASPIEALAPRLAYW